MSVALFALVAVSAANPAAGKFEDVMAGSAKLRIHFPAGYCKPEGTDVATFQVLAQGDQDNVTLLSLVECKKTSASRYVIFKAPVAFLGQAVNRKEAISEIAAALEGPEYRAKLESGEILNEVAKDKTVQNRSETEMSGQILPRGHDDVCVYLGGMATTRTSEASQTQAMAACLSVVGERLVSINAYEDSIDPAGYRAVMARTREWMSLVESQ